jgi:hypothetical protein
MPDKQAKHDCYDRLLSVVRLNTSAEGRLPPALSDRGARTVLCANGQLTPEGYRRAKRATVENGDLVAGAGYLTLPDADRCRAAIPFVIERCEAPHGFVAAANGVVGDD